MKRLLLSLSFAVCLSSFCTAQTTILGGDMSMLPRYEEAGVSYYDQNGGKISNLIDYVKGDDVKWNSLRVRLFVNPTKQAPSGDSDPMVCQDLEYVTALAKRIKDAGMNLLLDIFYSDTWADPSYQTKPAAWQNLTVSQLTQRMYDYTYDCLQHLKDNGATPDFIQVGNEISYGMLWPEGKVYVGQTANWSNFLGYVKNAVKACREVCPNAKIVIHTERTANANLTKSYYERLVSEGVDFDIIGLSYYPFWHGALSNLATTLTTLKSSLPAKQVHIVETAYYYQYYPTEVTYDMQDTWAANAEGQAAFATDLVAELKKHDNVGGLYWWFPEENGNGPSSNKVIINWIGRGLWSNRSHRAQPALYVLKDFLTGKNNDDTPPTPLRGDVNGDGKVDIADIAEIIDIMAGK